MHWQSPMSQTSCRHREKTTTLAVGRKGGKTKCEKTEKWVKG